MRQLPRVDLLPQVKTIDTFISRRSARGYAYAPRLSECPSEELEGWKFTVRGVWEDADLRLGCIDELLNDYEGMKASV